MKTLLHTCCAPCFIECADSLRTEGIEPVVFWYNPNIHPFTEYRERKNALLQYAGENSFEVLCRDEYGLRTFIEGVYPDFDSRCPYCYGRRLGETARAAAENGFESFSTTLLISPYQKHELICEIAEKAAASHGVKFLYRDFRPLFRTGQKHAREKGLYMQKFCGCIFSEEERYM